MLETRHKSLSILQLSLHNWESIKLFINIRYWKLLDSKPRHLNEAAIQTRKFYVTKYEN